MALDNRRAQAGKADWHRPGDPLRDASNEIGHVPIKPWRVAEL